MVSTRRRSLLIDETSSSSVKVAPPEKKQVSTRRRSRMKTVTITRPVKVAPPEKKQVSTRRTSRMKTVTNTRSVKLAPPKKKHVSTSSTRPSEIPQMLYDLIQEKSKLSESDYELDIHIAVSYLTSIDELPLDWKYDPETFYVPKPPTPPKPKTKKKMKMKINWSSYNYHGPYQLNDTERKVWSSFTMTDRAAANQYEMYPYEDHLHTVDDIRVVDLLGKFAVNTFNKSCKMYVDKDEDNQVSGAEFMKCKFYKLTWKYIFYMTIEAIEQGIRGVYETILECVPENGAMTLLNFLLTDRKPKRKRSWVIKPRLESEFDYETVEDGASDPEDFYKLTGMVHRLTESGGFDYHNPAYSPHILIYCCRKDEKASSFSVNVSKP